MNYISSRELSEKWNIGQRRIIVLARDGRIPGAKLYGKTWMFPENAIKPADGRTKSGKVKNSHMVTKDEIENFRFPNYEYKNAASFNPPLSDIELTLKTFVEYFNSCRFNEAEKISGTLPVNSGNRYHRIYALYCSCMLDLILCSGKRFLDDYGKLQTEFVDNFPYKDEMLEFIYQLDATLGADEYYNHEFNTKPPYYYHESFLPRLCNLQAFSLTLSETAVSQSTLQACESNCCFLEQTDNYFDLQSLHIYLGCTYAILSRQDERDYHFKKALKLAEKYDIFYNLAIQYYYMAKEFEPALEDFPTEFRKKLVRLSNELHSKLAVMSNEMQLNDIYSVLKSNDYIFVVYAVQGLSNKNIASKVHISVGAVGKKYSNIYALLGVKNKSELVELYNRSRIKKPDVL